ncbi:MAG: DUF87 domain-containing protein [Chloroflexi bacterium]|nr:DUF87 domain-containing protein [Chloroflexota bacterium]
MIGYQAGSDRDLGVVVGGTLSKGLTIRLHDPEHIEHMHAGDYVVVLGNELRYLSVITDLALKVTDEHLLANPPDDLFTRQVLSGTATYATVELLPTLALETAGGKSQILPVRSIPAHFSRVQRSTKDDFTAVFGEEDATHFCIGKPLDSEHDIYIDLTRLTERSNGVFGKTGTGKSFLTRLLIAGTIQKNTCANLIFDMHNEYGWQGVSEGSTGKRSVKGLKQLFGSRVKLFTLDRKGSDQRGEQVDGDIFINPSEIAEEDILLLGSVLNLRETAPAVLSALQRHYGTHWLSKLVFLDQKELDTVVEETGANKESVRALARALGPLRKMSFILWERSGMAEIQSAPITFDEVGEDVPPSPVAASSGASSQRNSAVRDILTAVQNGQHVVVGFPAKDDLLSYLLVVNLLTRRLREHYVTETNRSIASRQGRPRQIMITIEEAHRFLDPAVAQNTVFGEIAREMRKYGMSLLVVDQRPSAIDDEIVSQLGTRFICLLDDEKDVRSALSGVSGATRLQTVLASLETRGQALLIGHALPMPIAVRTRAYDQDFYRAMAGSEQPEGEQFQSSSFVSRMSRR